MDCLRSRVAAPRPRWRAGFSVASWPAWFPLALLLLRAPAAAGPGRIEGRIVDGDSGAPLDQVRVRLVPLSAAAASRTTHTDSSGAFELSGLAPGPWGLRAEAFGYRAAYRVVHVAGGGARVDLQLRPRPLVMDEMVVRARRDRAAPPGAFIESLPVADRGAGADLALALDRATGVDVRRYGGLGSFSTVSIRGSTAEQVAVFLDGVPLNHALGGGVDLGSLPLGGVESIDVYRGAVPARFGGNSLGGVIHIRTREPSRTPRIRLRTSAGSYGTLEIAATATGRRGSWQLLGLLDHRASRNDFRFWDDNGTEYNPADDGWTRRLNSDYGALRILAKAVRPLGASRLQVHDILDLSRRGIPGIGNNQSLHTRYDTWRSVTEALLYGPTLGAAGYRLKAYYSHEVGEYRDLRGEVGIGTQHDRNTTRAAGLRGELSTALPGGAVLTAFSALRAERFSPRDLLRPEEDLASSRRLALRLGGELDLPLWASRLSVNAGGQLERLHDRLVDRGDYGAGVQARVLSNRETLWALRGGATVDLGAGWRLQGHVGRYGRAPSFFELFGDRGAVLGNTGLASEQGLNIDAGLVYAGEAGTGTRVLLAEAVVYRNAAVDLIRFVQNSQRVSRPHNLGAARIRGLETRLQARPLARLRAEGSYVYQRAENRAPFPFERGNDLPNAPRHRLHGRLAVDAGPARLHYEWSHESRNFLDRANLRRVPARTIHGLGLRARLASGLAATVEVRNLTGNQVADLWGYPLPGRSLFLSLSVQHSRKPE